MIRLLLVIFIVILNTCYAHEYNMWINPIYYSDQQYNDGEIESYKTNSAGVIFGLERDLDCNTKIGSSISYFYAKQDDINDLNTYNNINHYGLSVYGSNTIRRNTYIEWLGNVAFNNYSNNTQFANNSDASGAFYGQQLLAKASLKNNYKNNKFIFVPSIDFNFLYLHQNSYNLITNNSNIEIDHKHAGVFTLGLGLKISTNDKPTAIIKPELRGMVLYDIFSAAINPLTAMLIGGPALDTSAMPARTSGLLGVGVVGKLYKNTKYYFNYDLLLKSRYFNNVLSLTLYHYF